MKRFIWIMSIGFAIITINACSDSKDRYIDLSTGKAVVLEKDPVTGLMVSAETKKPLYIYVDTKKNDTIYGSTGAVINGHVYKNTSDKYVYDEDEKLKATDANGEVKYKDGDYKVKVEKDGDMTIKNGDKKTEIDGKTGEKKTKKD